MILHVHLLLLLLSTDHVLLIDGCARHCLSEVLVGCIYLLIDHHLSLELFVGFTLALFSFLLKLFAFFLEFFGFEMRILEVLAVDEADQNEE